MYTYVAPRAAALRRYIPIAVIAICCLYIFYSFAGQGLAPSNGVRKPFSAAHNGTTAVELYHLIATESQYFVDYPLPNSASGEIGERTQSLTQWISQAEAIAPELRRAEKKKLTNSIEGALLSLFPFIRNPSHPNDRAPFSRLRKSYVPGSSGIVIPTGKSQFRFTAHLIGNIRDVLGSQLPIQIAYAGDNDLPREYRDSLTSLGPDIETLDVLKVLDDKTLKLAEGGWAIKPFAILASKFEQVILMDADDVFLRQPEIILEKHSGYKATGTLLFHDRLLWQNVSLERAKWWKEQMKHHTPSATLVKSKFWTEGYAEEGDSGVVALDKSRLAVLMGLLHICWQNTESVRREWTYRLTYGDKESWWFGFELSSVPYSMESHYGAVLGATTTEEDGEDRVCGSSIVHFGEHDRLLWYNGSLLKNKAVSLTEFIVPSSWMIDAEWLKGATKADLSCMRGGKVRAVDRDALRVVSRSVNRAKELDAQFSELIGPLE